MSCIESRTTTRSNWGTPVASWVSSPVRNSLKMPSMPFTGKTRRRLVKLAINPQDLDFEQWSDGFVTEYPDSDSIPVEEMPPHERVRPRFRKWHGKAAGNFNG